MYDRGMSLNQVGILLELVGSLLVAVMAGIFLQREMVGKWADRMYVAVDAIAKSTHYISRWTEKFLPGDLDVVMVEIGPYIAIFLITIPTAVILGWLLNMFWLFWTGISFMALVILFMTYIDMVEASREIRVAVKTPYDKRERAGKEQLDRINSEPIYSRILYWLIILIVRIALLPVVFLRRIIQIPENIMFLLTGILDFVIKKVVFFPVHMIQIFITSPMSILTGATLWQLAESLKLLAKRDRLKTVLILTGTALIILGISFQFVSTL